MGPCNIMLSDALVGIYKRGLMPAWRSSQVSTSSRRRWSSPGRSPSQSTKSPDTDTSLLSAPISGLPSSSSNLLTDAEEIIRKVTTMDISEIMLTQYQIQSIMWRGAGRSSNCKILFLTKKHLSRILSYHLQSSRKKKKKKK